MDPITRLNAALEGRYRIERELGEGGMATVYLADDLKHERKVALKVLKPELAAAVGAERFLAEIKTTANLQHPHILPLFDSGEADGFLFYVMPYVDGESLRERLDREVQLPIGEAVALATDIAEALDYAHRRGVMHRDIKPGNILLHEGRPLIADFGIGLALSAAGGERLTQTGLSVGTPAYMSPEQASAEPRLDARADVYSLAATLYEMLAGHAPFEGATTPAVLAQVLTTEAPRVSTYRRNVPGHVDAAIDTALQKLPADRFSSAADFSRALADHTYMRPPVTRKAAERQPVASGARRAAVVIGVALITGLAFWFGRVSRPNLVEPEPTRFTVRVPAGQQISSHPTLSPDGRRLVYAANRDDGTYLALQDFGEFGPRHLPGTLGAEHPFFSPNGDQIGYFAGRRLHRISTPGLTSVTVAEVPQVPAGGVWTEGGDIIYGTLDQGLFSVPAAGGQPRPLTHPDPATGGGAHGWPQVIPGGRVLFTVGTSEGPRLALYDVETQAWRRLEDFGQVGGAQYLPGGFLLYAQSGRLLVAPVDPMTLERTGSPVTLPDTPDVHVGVSHALRKAWFTVSDNGHLAFVSLSGSGGTAQLVWVHRDGSEERLNGETGFFAQARLAPDGRRLAVIQAPNLAIYGLPSGIRETVLPGPATEPVWSWDADEIFLASNRAGVMGIYRVSTDGSDEHVLLRGGDQSLFPHSISPDGRTLAFYEINATTARDIWMLPVRGDGEPAPFRVTSDNERSPTFSPDGDRLAFVSDQSGRDQVYVAPVRGGGRPEPVSTDGGTEPLWSRDGSELFYRNGDQMLAVAVRGDGSFEAPEVLFEGQYKLGWPASGVREYDVSADGRRFLMVKPGSDRSTLTQVHVVQNWLAQVPDLVPRRD